VQEQPKTKHKIEIQEITSANLKFLREYFESHGDKVLTYQRVAKEIREQMEIFN